MTVVANGAGEGCRRSILYRGGLSWTGRPVITEVGENVSDVADAMKMMQAKFNPSAAVGLDVVFGFNVTDEDAHYSLVVKDGACQLQEGENADANCTLVLDSETLKGIVSGETDGMQAFMDGKMRVEGDMMLSQKLSELFSA
jgi:putative sterol carrier protein